ncbi:hypothetical protein M8J76_008509 [Diaphorina citri]|nr:hypothetical protein M8J76_009779 [Diaphorina citri]KAI5749585.1 hypothetical protein M8J76_008509 [Diaphorina citri]KAI5755401.1 hypothetical protein M8J77_016477 [Diaphorina citri]
MSSKPSFSSVVNRNIPRSSSNIPKSAAPSAFSSYFSRPGQSKPVNDSLLLPMECAFSLPCIDAISIDKYFIAVGEIVGFQNIIYGGKNGSKIVMHLSSQSILNDFVSKNETIKIDDDVLPIRKLIDPGLILYLHNTAPHLPNDLLEEELKKTVRLLSEIKLTNYGMRDPRLRHILAYKRQVQIPTEDKAKVPIYMNVTWKNIPHTIHLSFDSPRCYSCGKEGHISKNCLESTQSTIQKRLDDIKAPAPVPISTPEETLLPDLDDSMGEGDDVESHVAQASTPDDVQSVPSCDVQNVFLPKFALQRSSSSPSLSEDNQAAAVPAQNINEEFPVLKSPVVPKQSNSKSSKRTLSSESISEKKAKVSSPPSDPELTDGFRALVQKVAGEIEENPVSAESICQLLDKYKNTQQKQDLIQESNLPLANFRNILQSIHDCPDTSANIKARITRLLKGVLAEPKMTLKNIVSA